MGRPRNFDADSTLDRAVEIFRCRGWRRTSLDDLVEELGVPRQSLYNTYGDKDALYRAALARYSVCQTGRFAELLADARPVRAVLRDLLASKIEEVLAAPDSWGCMVLNATLERADDEDLRGIVRRNNEALEGILSARLARAQAEGELGAHHDPRALGRFLLNTLVGLAVLGRGKPDRAALEDTARIALAALG